MKAIHFKTPESQQLYDDYIDRIQRTVSVLPPTERQDIVMELNSHIYEGMQGVTIADENEKLKELLLKMGSPEEVLQPLIANNSLQQAAHSYNPITIAKALVLNIGNGIKYIIFTILYLLLFGFVFLIIAKIRNPKEVGLYFKNGSFHLLGTRNSLSVQRLGLQEVLGNWFIPVMLLGLISLYLVITLLLQAQQKRK